MRGKRSCWIVRVVVLLVALIAQPVAAQGGVVPNDPLYPDLWGLRQVNAPGAWAATRGDGVTVAVVDSGIDLEHPDLVANVRPGKTFLNCGDEGCGDGDWDDGSNHGTHVAGTVAATANNGIGVVGVAPEANILAVRVLDGSGRGSAGDVARGIRWAVDNGADVINLSLGGLQGTQLLSAAGLSPYAQVLQHAVAKGVLVVAAAGNSTFPLCSVPAWEDAVVCVTATDRRGASSFYTNFAVKPGFNAVAAPGGSVLEIANPTSSLTCAEGVLSTIPAGSGYDFYAETCNYPADLAYHEYSGTSMASPHVAGVAALLRSLGCTAAQSADVLKRTARNPLTDERGEWSANYGYGIVDAAAAVQAAASVCTPPDGVPGVPAWDACRVSRAQRFDGASLPDGWKAEMTVSNGTPGWHVERDEQREAAWMVTDATGTDAKDDRLVAPAFLGSDDTQVRFSHRFFFESHYADYEFRDAEFWIHDAGVLELSVDGGPWEQVPDARIIRGPYNGGVQEDSTSALAGRRGWVGSSGGNFWDSRLGEPLYERWMPVVVDLSGYEERHLRVSWRMVQDSARTGLANRSQPGVAWWLDDVEVVHALDPACLQ